MRAGMLTLPGKQQDRRPEQMEKDKKTDEQRCRCPYCDIPVSAQAVLCGGCGTKLRFCSECGCPIPRIAQRCPECGAKLETSGKQRLEL
jgi:predicted amidophosphoribosyltransferase